MRSGGRAAKGSETQRLCSEQKSPTRQGRLFKEDEMKVYKGTDENMVCHGKQYVPGEMATEEKAKLCECGMHACEMPLDVLKYYPPNCSRYFDAEADDVSDERSSDDSKIVAKKMTLKAEIGIPGLVKAQVEYIKKQIGFDDAIKRADAEKENHATGDWGAASATGNRGAASATGYQGAASATGKSGIALAAGCECKAKGALGCAICCVERGGWNGETYPILAVKAAIVDGETVKPDTWYMLKNGEFVEAENE
nr:MAG: hypothetical protein [Bacteriophage sp.]